MISGEWLGISVERLGISDKSPINHSSLIANPLSLTPNPYFDLVYFDAFAPEKQPEMWSEELFRNIYACMNANGILTTYCAKGVIRRLLQAVGFIGGAGLPARRAAKREVLRATKTKG